MYVHMLDLTIFRARSHLRWKFFRKDSARHLPLSTASFHPQAVHRSWPIAEVGRAWRNSMCSKSFVKAMDIMTDRWSACFMPGRTIEKCMAWMPRIGFWTRGWLDPVKAKPSEAKVVHLVVPYHPGLHGLQTKLGQLIRAYRGILPFDLDVKIVYRKGDRHLLQILQHNGR